MLTEQPYALRDVQHQIPWTLCGYKAERVIYALYSGTQAPPTTASYAEQVKVIHNDCFLLSSLRG